MIAELLRLESGRADPELYRAWLEQGVDGGSGRWLAGTGVHPRAALEFVRAGHSTERLRILLAYSSGQLDTLPTAGLDRLLRNFGIDVSEGPGARAFAMANEIVLAFGYDWGDAALLAASEIDLPMIEEMVAAFPSPPAPEVMLEIRRVGLPSGLASGLMGQGISLDDLGAAHRAGVTPERLVYLQALGLTVSDALVAAGLWGEEEPHLWMNLLSCSYSHACAWRLKIPDLRLASQWHDTVGRLEVAEDFLNAGVPVGEVVGWRNAGVLGVESVLRHRVVWTAVECANASRELGLSADEALEWRSSGIPAEESLNWRALGRSLDQARRARTAGLGPIVDRDFIALGVAGFDEVLEHHRVWPPSELSEWVNSLGVECDAALQWRLVCGDPLVVGGWIAAGVGPVEAAGFIALSLGPGDRAAWSAVGVVSAELIAVLVGLSLSPGEFREWEAVLAGDVEQILVWVRAGVDVGVARVVCGVVPDVDEALRWSCLRRPVDEVLRLIREGASVGEVEGFVGLGVDGIEELCAAVRVWGVAEACEWMVGLGVCHARAVEWFGSGGTIAEALICGSPEELSGWVALGVREDSGLERIRDVMSVEDAAVWRAAGWGDLSRAVVWCVASKEPGSGLDAVSALEWEPTGLDPLRVSEFIGAGVGVDAVIGWVRLGVADLSGWSEACGLWSSVDEAAVWCESLFEPLGGVGAWRRAFDDLDVVVAWRGLGSLEAACEWDAAGWAPAVAELWIREGFGDVGEVVAWSGHGFDAGSAAVWRDFGVDADSAGHYEAEGLNAAEFRRIMTAFPGRTASDIVWLWSLERAGLQLVDEIPTLDVSVGRPATCRIDIEGFLRDCSDCGVQMARVVHHGGGLDTSLVPLLADPVFVRGAGRVVLEHWETLDPDLCIETVEHFAAESLVTLFAVVPRTRIFRSTHRLERAS